MSEEQKKIKYYAVSGIFTKAIPNGLNIQGNIEIVDANSLEEAIGKYIIEIKKHLPEHNLFQTPLAIDISDYQLTAEQKAKVIRLCEIIENNVDRYCSQCDYKKYQAGDNPCGDCEYPLAKQLKEELQ